MPSCPSTLKPRWMMCTISRSWGMAIARAWSSARATSDASITPPGTATTPRLLIEETCPPARLTSADVISMPEVCSAFSTEWVMACEACGQVHDHALRDAFRWLDAHADDADTAASRLRRARRACRLWSCRRRFRQRSLPWLLAHPVVRRIRVLHADEGRRMPL